MPGTPIIDSHCHAWRRWPYRPEVPDPESRGLVEQLLFEMDDAGVEQAAVVCARITHNADDNDYVAECVRRYPQRLHQLADVDCSWSETYHTPGAADRLTEAAERYPLAGFTHYVKSDDDGSWFLSAEGLAFFRVAEARGLLASLALPPHLQPVLRQLAERFPTVPFLVHHMGGLKAAEAPPYPVFKDVLASAARPNIYVKLSGFHYASPVAWEYPYSDCAWLVRGLYEHFGPHRLCWGSDYPVVRKAMTYRQALEAVRTHCPFIPPEHKERILGGNLQQLLRREA
ncbi:MAG TPA: amidohydrolase family protein [Chloroflexota bacterium]|jgi:L-fuconolactonase|nr:amidohydrolase family protein [Chloroflexota bacterium]